MDRYSSWTMVRETIPWAVTSNSVSLRLIWAQLSERPSSPRNFSSHPTQLPLQEHQIMKIRSALFFFTSSKRNPQSARREHTKWNVRREPAESADTKVNPHFFILSQWTQICWNLTEKPGNFISLLLLNLLIIQSFKEDVQDQYIFSEKRADKTPFNSSDIQRHLCNYLSLLLHWRWTMETQVMLCHKVHPSIGRKRKTGNYLINWLLLQKKYLPDILLSFVEFLSQIFSRRLTGDLNHGQLLAIASHVAGGLTDTVIVVFLYQKVCGWSKSFMENETKPANKSPEAKNTSTTNRCHRSLSMKANNDWSYNTEEDEKKKLRHIFTMMLQLCLTSESFQINPTEVSYQITAAQHLIEFRHWCKTTFNMSHSSVGSPSAGSAHSLYCSGVQTVEVPVWNNNTWNINQILLFVCIW